MLLIKNTERRAGMDKDELKLLEIKVKRRIAMLVSGIGALGFIGLIIFVFFYNQPEKPEPSEPRGDYPTQEAFVKYDKHYPTQSMGTVNQYWEYRIPFPEDEYEDRQDIIDSGKLLLWKDYTEDNVMWIVGHNPGTMSYVAEHTDVGSLVDVTSPSMYEGRYPYDDPDVMTFEIVEVLHTDINAQDKFVTLDVVAGDLYNYGADGPLLVLQHSGEGDEIVLYLGELIEHVKGERISHTNIEESDN